MKEKKIPPNKLREIISGMFSAPRTIIFSIVVGVSTGTVIYLGLLQNHFFSWRYLLYFFLICITTFFLVSWLNHRFIFQKYSSLPKNLKLFLITLSMILTGILLININIQPLYYILPDKYLEIEFKIEDLPQGEEGVRLLWVETGQGYVHYTKMDIEGEWERVFGNTVFPPGQSIKIKWQGKVGKTSDITFRSTNFKQTVNITWDGKKTTHQLQNPDTPNVQINHNFQIPLIHQFPFIFSFGISVTYCLILLILAVANWNPVGKVKPKKTRESHWLCFMLPMLATWGFTLLVFWPGIISNDSIFQLRQGLVGQFDDWQSAFHAFLLAGLFRLWPSPVLISILQIGVFAITVAWGLKMLADYGVPKKYLWVVSFLFAFFPPNWILSITIWKDIAYAIAFLWLTILITKVVLSEGEWLKNKSGWIPLSMSAFLVSIFRKNGIATAAISLIILFVLYRKFWQEIFSSIIIAILLFLIITGPIYKVFKVSRTDYGQTNLIYLHHIAAHVDAKTDLKAEEREYLSQLLPLSDWFYWSCYVGTISYDDDFARNEFLANSSLNRKIALDLFARAPWVDLVHTTRAGELSWKFMNNDCYMKSTHGFNNWEPGQEDWVVPNKFGMEQQSKFPHIVSGYVRLLRRFGFLDDNLASYLRPAFWMYIALFSMTVITLRRKDFYLWAAILPIITQALVLMAISFAPAYRYHFGTCLSGIFLICLIFLPVKRNKSELET